MSAVGGAARRPKGARRGVAPPRTPPLQQAALPAARSEHQAHPRDEGGDGGGEEVLAHQGLHRGHLLQPRRLHVRGLDDEGLGLGIGLGSQMHAWLGIGLGLGYMNG